MDESVRASDKVDTRSATNLVALCTCMLMRRGCDLHLEMQSQGESWKGIWPKLAKKNLLIPGNHAANKTFTVHPYKDPMTYVVSVMIDGNATYHMLEVKPDTGTKYNSQRHLPKLKSLPAVRIPALQRQCR